VEKTNLQTNMKTKLTHRLSPRSPHCRTGFTLTLLLTALTGLAAPLGTDFTYQGHLDGPTGPASGHYDLSFALHLASTGGTPVAAVTNYNVGVSNGLFTTAIDFGAGFFNGNAYWLQLGVRTNGTVAFTPLSPRQALTPTPNALYATLAATVPGGAITAAQLGANSVGTTALQPNSVVSNKIANAQVVRSLNGLQDLVALAAGTNTTLTTNGNTLTLAGSSDWKLVGNASTTPGVNFVGTTDNQPLEFKVNNQRGLRLEPTASTDTVNVIAGSARNIVTPNVMGATIGGGGAGNVGGLAYTNRVGANFGTVSGGGQNTIQTNAAFATIGGGTANTIQTNANYATLGGGAVNAIGKDGFYTTIGGGNLNATGPGASWATIGGGSANGIGQDSSYTTIGGGKDNAIQRGSGHATIGGGIGNRIQEIISYATIGGGYFNTVQTLAGAATIGGGSQNTIQASARFSTISGGDQNTNLANAYYAAIGGGGQNTILTFAQYATIPGGQLNSAGNYAFAAGRRAKATHEGSFVWADSTDADFTSTANKQFLIRAGGNVGINKNNPATALDVNGTVTATSFSGSGAGLGGLSASQLTTGTLADARLSANVSLLGQTIESLEITDGTIAPADLNPTVFNTAFWKTTGNTGTAPGTHFVGTADNQSLVMKVNNTVALQITPGITVPNIVGGLAGIHPSFIASGVSGAVIAGGNAPSGVVYGFNPGDIQAVYDDDGTVGGGFGNKVGTDNGNVTDAAFATVAGGVFNSAMSYAATVAGGDSNLADGQRAAVLGGFDNRAGGAHSAVGGGLQNTIQTGAAYSSIGGGHANTIQTNATDTMIGGGSGNLIQSGVINSTIGGGLQNTIKLGTFGTTAATIAGGAANTIQTEDPRYATIGGGYSNIASEVGSTVGGGYQNTSTGAESTVAGGYLNTASLHQATVGGGFVNTASGLQATVSGGGNNTASGTYATVGGGSVNTSSGFGATVSGGAQNSSAAQYATMGGGGYNLSSGYAATVPGGTFNTAGGDYSLAAGYRAKANHAGTFVWADSTFADFASTANNQFLIRAAGGVGINTNNPNGAALAVHGVVTASSSVTEAFEVRGAAAGYALQDRVTGAAGRWSMFASDGTLGFYSASAGTTRMWVDPAGIVNALFFNNTSDRNLKEKFTPVSAREVLDKVAALPLSEWNYKADTGSRHLGPMAQDFRAAFGLGTDERHIATVDADGIALAAIQGLNQKLTEELTRRDTENAELKVRMERLEQLLNAQNGGPK
jgi:hypothetical protein